MMIMVTCGPTDSKNCPTNQGKNMLPTLAPARNMLVIFPLRCRCFSAKVIDTGKSDAIEKPVIAVPIHITAAELENKRMIPGPITHPTRL